MQKKISDNILLKETIEINKFNAIMVKLVGFMMDLLVPAQIFFVVAYCF
jgi:hypothetical protein